MTTYLLTLVLVLIRPEVICPTR